MIQSRWGISTRITRLHQGQSDALDGTLINRRTVPDRPLFNFNGTAGICEECIIAGGWAGERSPDLDSATRALEGWKFLYANW